MIKGNKSGCAIVVLTVKGAIILTICVFLAGITIAQNKNLGTDGYTPSGLTPGNPVGSFPLSGFEQINPYNGSLNFYLPLLQIGGRGSAGTVVPLKIEQRKWTVEFETETVPCGSMNTCKQDYYFPQPYWWEAIAPGYGPGILQGRSVNVRQGGYYSSSCFNDSLTRLTFRSSDGTEYELIDSLTDGAIGTTGGFASPGQCYSEGVPGTNRGRIFKTTDGTSATFIADNPGIYDTSPNPFLPNGIVYPTGYLYLRDGTQYRIEHSVVTWLRDRNGNKINFQYDANYRVSLITDSIGRRVTFNYNVQEGGGVGLCDKISYKGFDHANDRVIRISKSTLSNKLRSGYTPMNYGELFPVLDGGGNPFNPEVVSALWLPDGRSYKFLYNPYGELAQVELPTGALIKYEYSAGLVNGHASGVIGDYNVPRVNVQSDPASVAIYRRLVERRVFPDGTTLESKSTYSRPESLIAYPTNAQNLGYVIMEVRNTEMGGTPISSEKHYYFGSPHGSLIVNYPLGRTGWKEGKEAQLDLLATDGSALRRSVFDWRQNSPFYQDEAYPPHNPRLAETVTTLIDANLVSKVSAINPNTGEVGFDNYNNQKDIYEYDYGTGSPGSLIRHTHSEYLANGYDVVAGTMSNPDLATTVHIRGLPTLRQVIDSNGVVRAQTNYEYDNYNQTNPDAFHDILKIRPDISGLCDGSAQNCPNGPNFTSASYRTRGNLTMVKNYSDATNLTGAITTYQQYDVAGNVVKAIDAGRADNTRSTTTLEYDDKFGTPDGDTDSNTSPTELGTRKSYAFATLVMNQLGHKAYTQYDYYVGKPVNSEDANGVVSSISYNDLLDRPKEGIAGVGLPNVNRKTSFSYDDSVNNMGTFADQDALGDAKLQSKVKYDGLGRVFRKGIYEGNGWILTETQFDALGRVWKVSNPYRASSFDNPTPQPTEWTITDYDTLSRVIRMTTPDGAHIDTVYNGNSVTVTEPFDSSQSTQPGYAIRKRTNYSDALGRLIRVIEDPGGKNHITDYVYDVLGNLRQVTQDIPSGDSQYPSGVQQRRYFMYDSLSRLIWARNPEQVPFANVASNPMPTDPITNNSKWTLRYQYDNNGNLTGKHDPRSGYSARLIAYGYDALNRPKEINYLDGTPQVIRTYDNSAAGAYGIGRPYETKAGSNQAGSNTPQDQEYHSIDQYDALGRPLAMTQKFNTAGITSNNYTLQRVYDLAGHIKTQTYPSGHKVFYDYDAAGRLMKFSGSLGDNLQHTYADNIQYTESGQMTQERFLTTKNLYHSLLYNKRHQIVEVDLGTTFNSAVSQFWNRGRLRYYYGLSAKNPNTNLDGPNFDPAMDYPDNNGNVIVAEHRAPETIGSLDTIASYSIPQRDEYDYDALNRILKVTGKQRTTGGAINTIYQQAYSYDRFGNRTINAAMTSGNGINNRVYTVNVDSSIAGNSFVTNRFNELAYDVAGNVTNDPNGAGGCSYDAENRMTTASGAGNTAGGQYVYDGDGHRTRFRPNTYTAQPYWKYFVYGFDGELVAEYPLQALPNNPGTEYGYRGGEKLIVATGTSGQTPAGSTVNLPVSNNGFETPAVGRGGYVYNPAGGSWMFAGTSGISKNGSTITAGNGNAPEGSQAAFLQGGSTAVISQQISGFAANRYYQVVFQAATGSAATGEKGGGALIPATFEVFVDDSSLGVFQPSSVNYIEYTTPVFLVPSGKGTVRFVSLSPKDGDITALIDNIRIIGSAPNIVSDIKWMVTDHLGTPRMVVALGGQLSDVSRHDYLPFGEEVNQGVGNGSLRSAGNGYSQDNVRQKFTAKEHDEETVLDYFVTRYYSSNQGRFTSPDRLLASAETGNPQTWNRYAYVDDNPLRYADSDGMLKKDKSGKLIFEEINCGYYEHGGSMRRSGSKIISTRYFGNEGYLFTEDGTKIKAFRSAQVSVDAVYNIAANGHLVMEGEDQSTANRNDHRMDADCHGLSFAGGAYWINNDQVMTLLQHDGYAQTNETTPPQVGDIAVYLDQNNKVVHTATVTGVSNQGEVTQVAGLGGINMEARATTPQGQFEASRIQYWHKNGESKTAAKERANTVKRFFKGISRVFNPQ